MSGLVIDHDNELPPEEFLPSRRQRGPGLQSCFLAGRGPFFIHERRR